MNILKMTVFFVATFRENVCYTHASDNIPFPIDITVVYQAISYVRIPYAERRNNASLELIYWKCLTERMGYMISKLVHTSKVSENGKLRYIIKMT